jgi:hypothetical protein
MAAALGGTLRISVRDPKGAVIAGASVSLRPASQKTFVAAGVSDPAGVFTAKDVAPGQYVVIVEDSGFESAEQTVAVGDKDVELTVTLAIAPVVTAIEVEGKRSPMANSDPNYRALRDAPIATRFRVENVELKRDGATFIFKDGHIAFVAPVLGKRVMAVFSGTGRLHFEAASDIDRSYLKNLLGTETVDEEFDTAVFALTDGTFEEVERQTKAVDAAGPESEILKQFRKRMRRRVEFPRSMTEDLFHGDGVPNIEAQLLAEIYNAKRGGSFRAFLHGKKHSDLRFLLVPRGAIPDLPSPEEVALVNLDPLGEEDGIWYLSHFVEEHRSFTASANERKHTLAPEHYRIETVIGGDRHLTALAEIRIQPIESGDRVISFGLLPSLRVTRVTGEDGRDLLYLQEDRKQDGAFYVILPEPAAKGKSLTLKVAYEGNKVIEDWGGGNFAVGARQSWYPSLNAF